MAACLDVLTEDMDRGLAALARTLLNVDSFKEKSHPMSSKIKNVFVFALIVLSAYAGVSRGQGSHNPSRFTYVRLYCTPEGDTHFQDVTVELREMNFAPPAAPIYIGGDVPASSVFFGGFDAAWGAHDLETRLNHPAPATQFGVVLRGVFSITTTDGETRRFRPGDVFRVEDTSPCKGHITVVGDQPGMLMFAR
jgi:hypothetical protein